MIIILRIFGCVLFFIAALILFSGIGLSSVMSIDAEYPLLLGSSIAFAIYTALMALVCFTIASLLEAISDMNRNIKIIKDLFRETLAEVKEIRSKINTDNTPPPLPPETQ